MHRDDSRLALFMAHRPQFVSYLYLDGRDGGLLGFYALGEGTAGDIFTTAQFALHSRRLAGVAGRAVIYLAGMAVTVLSITGVIIWWRKCARRVHRAAAAPAALA